MDKKYLMLGAVAAGLVVGFAIYRGTRVVGEAAIAAANAVNPMNNANVFNTGFESAFNTVAGKPISEVLIPGSFDPTSGNNLVNRLFEESWLYKASRDGSLDPTDSNNYANRAFETVKGWF